MIDYSGHCTSIIINDVPLTLVVSHFTALLLNTKNISKFMFYLRYKKLKWDNGIRNKRLKTRQRVKTQLNQKLSEMFINLNGVHYPLIDNNIKVRKNKHTELYRESFFLQRSEVS